MKIEVYSPTIKRKEMDAVLSAMVQDKIGPGGEAKFLIQTAREKLGFDYCLALRSPAIALFLFLKSLNMENGSGVVISALSPLYYSRVINDLGLSPIYCDVHSSKANISRETIEKAISNAGGKAKAGCIILYNTLGYICDIDEIVDFGLPVLEDCSQSYGTVCKSDDEDGNVISTRESRAAPSQGNGVFAILGLEERDMLTSGGGALLFSYNRKDSALLRNLGDLPPEYGLPDMNASMAIVQFKEAAKNIKKRREIARLYTQSALRTRHKCFVLNENIEYNNFAFPLILQTGMKDVKAYARRNDIAVESAFENSLIGNNIVPPEQCPESYSLSLRTVLFPIHPRLRASEAERVAKLIQTLP